MYKGTLHQLIYDIMIREMYAWHEYLKKVTDKGSGYLNEV